MKRIIAVLIVLTLCISPCHAAFAEILPSDMTFSEILRGMGIDEVSSAVIVGEDGKCADIAKGDLENWLDSHYNFTYDRVVAPLDAYNSEDGYIKLWNEDKTVSCTVYYPGSGIIVGSFGNEHISHGEARKMYIWYLPYIGNARNALYIASTELFEKYFKEGTQKREAAKEDIKEIPSANLLATDDLSNWARDEVDKAAACNLLEYDVSGSYGDAITRYEFCRLIYRLIATEFEPFCDSRVGIDSVIQSVLDERGIERDYTEKFSDCYYKEVNALCDMGIIYGMDDGTFMPDNHITREQAAAILLRTARFLGNKTITSTDSDGIYADESNISEWAIDSVRKISGMNIMQGMGNGEFSPKSEYTREQAIATMLRLYEHY